jgi:hypothetical protein
LSGNRAVLEDGRNYYLWLLLPNRRVEASNQRRTME